MFEKERARGIDEERKKERKKERKYKKWPTEN